jgi:energy-coupling factor transporter ATP-binding protein EcfA2
MILRIGEAQSGHADIDLSNSAGIRIIGSPGIGKSTLIETIAREAFKKDPNIRIVIFSTTGRFDYELPFDFEYYSLVRHREEALKTLEELGRSMNESLDQMEALGTKDVTKVPRHRPCLLICDELESVEEVLDKKDRERFVKLLTLRINGGRKTRHWTVVATQSQDLGATATRTRSLEYIVMGRPQTLGICQALSIDPKYFTDANLKKGRLLLIANGDCEVIKVRRES